MDYIRQVVVRNGDATGIRFLFEDRILTNFIYTEIGTDETLKKLLIDILDETIDGPIGFSGNENQCEITKEKVIITDELMYPGEFTEVDTEILLDIISKYILELRVFSSMKKSSIIKTRSVIPMVDMGTIHGKVSHKISYPVMRYGDGRWSITFFFTFPTAQDYRSGTMPRPEIWTESNIKTGEIIAVHNCKAESFLQTEVVDERLPKNIEQEHISKEKVDKMLSYFDSIRMELLLYGEFNESLYERYMHLLLDGMSEQNRHYYLALSRMP